MKKLLKQGLIVSAVVLLAATSVLIGRARAEDNASPQNSQEQRATKQAETKAKLADVKLKVCQQKEKHINAILGRIATRGDRQIDVFNKIAERTEAFYTSKGKALSNYDTLVNDVNAKKAAAQTAVNEVKSSSVTFKCDGSDPKGAAASFKDSLKKEIAALKAYKTAVKNLIVGVKNVQTESKTEKPE
jgi:mannitol-specific phosphotransferase system IIBC component